ncbi:MAG: AAA family ATPase [Candidatus Hodarchaeales archaeon]
MKAIEIMKNFGEVFFPEDIQESIDEIVGYESQKDFLHDFYAAIKSIASMSDSELPFAISLSALLVGPPGTGKTTLAKAYAKKYELPIFLVYADSLIGSILGKTLNNIRDALSAAHQYARNKTPILVFFDELDAIASERSSVYEVGEIKRAVVTLLQRMDAILASGDPIAFIGATNHQYLLDSAVWRRFCYNISFNFPVSSVRKEILRSFIKKIENSAIQVQITDFQLETLSSDEITGGYTGADLRRGFQIAILRALKDKNINEAILVNSLKSAGGTERHIENEARMAGRLEEGQKTENSRDFKSRLKNKKVF